MISPLRTPSSCGLPDDPPIYLMVKIHRQAGKGGPLSPTLRIASNHCLAQPYTEAAWRSRPCHMGRPSPTQLLTGCLNSASMRLYAVLWGRPKVLVVPMSGRRERGHSGLHVRAVKTVPSHCSPKHRSHSTMRGKRHAYRVSERACFQRPGTLLPLS